MSKSKIEWTGRSDWNPVRGCSRVTEACRNCYAEIMAARFSKPGMWGNGFAKIINLPAGGIDHRWTGKVELQEDRLLMPLSWRKPGLVFPNSTSDFFHEKLPDAARDELFAVMASCPHLMFQILTKRPEVARAYQNDPTTPQRIYDLVCDLSQTVEDFRPVLIARPGLERHAPPGPRVYLGQWPLPNVWIGTSVHDQASADTFIPELLATPAALRFISAEPLLGPMHLGYLGWPNGSSERRTGFNALIGLRYANGEIAERIPKLDWVIAGGESGPDARPMHPDWVRSLRDQCKAADVPFFFKQWGQWAVDWERQHDPDDRECPGRSPGRFLNLAGGHGFHGEAVVHVVKVGKDKSGRALDGRHHNEFPAAAGRALAA
jgi:protein gp37